MFLCLLPFGLNEEFVWLVKERSFFFLQTTEDAKRVVEEERALAHAEIENARAAVQRVEKAFLDQKLITSSSNKQVHVEYQIPYIIIFLPS